jgi:hypothetical protein
MVSLCLMIGHNEPLDRLSDLRVTLRGCVQRKLHPHDRAMRTSLHMQFASVSMSRVLRPLRYHPLGDQLIP